MRTQAMWRPMGLVLAAIAYGPDLRTSGRSTQLCLCKAGKKSLAILPKFDSVLVERQLIQNPSIRWNLGTDSRALETKDKDTYFGEWGYVRGILVKPNAKTNRFLFITALVTFALLLASEKLAKLDAVSTLLFCHILSWTSNMELKEVSMDLKCTQLEQKWNAPFLRQRTNIDFQFTGLTFEKAEEGKTRKRTLIVGI